MYTYINGKMKIAVYGGKKIVQCECKAELGCRCRWRGNLRSTSWWAVFLVCGETLPVRGATRYAFIAGPCPSLGAQNQAGIQRSHCTRRPLSPTATDPFGPLVGCPLDCNGLSRFHYYDDIFGNAPKVTRDHRSSAATVSFVTAAASSLIT